MSGVAGEEHKKAAGKMREAMANYEKNRDLILLGAYQYGTDPAVDRVAAIRIHLHGFESARALYRAGLA